MTLHYKKAFGRKQSPRTIEPYTPLAAIHKSVVAMQEETHDDIDAELDHWKSMRKARRRSFREPWRTAAIVSTIGFGLASWLLPDSVSNIVQLLTGGLTAASIIAGFRTKRTVNTQEAVSGEPTD